MIRIVKELQAMSLDTADKIWHRLPLVPATGTIETSDKKDESGRLATMKLNATLSDSDSDSIIRDNIMLRVTFCDGSVETYGSNDLPLSLSVTKADTLRISCAYEYPLF